MASVITKQPTTWFIPGWLLCYGPELIDWIIIHFIILSQLAQEKRDAEEASRVQVCEWLPVSSETELSDIQVVVEQLALPPLGF